MRLPGKLRVFCLLCLPVLLLLGWRVYVQRPTYQNGRVSQYLSAPLPSDYAALDAVTLKALVDLMKTYPTAKIYIVEWNGGESRPASIFFLPEKEIFGFDDGCPYNNYCGFMVAGDDIKISRSQLEEAQKLGLRYSLWPGFHGLSKRHPAK